MGARTRERNLHYAMSHPVRRRLLVALHARDTPCSPVGLSEELDLDLSNAGYHVRVLAECGAAKLVDERPVRGSMEHLYVSTVSEPWALLILEDEAKADEETAS